MDEMENFLDVPRKCVICKNTIIDAEALNKHACFFNYPYICVDKNGYLCPQREDETIVYELESSESISSESRSSELVSSEPVSSESASLESASSESVPSHSAAIVREDIEELLISSVKNRRELWDHTLPIIKRSRSIIATKWQEVSNELNSVLTADAACKKWRYLKDSYMRIRNDIIKKKSGSAANKPIKWKWYEYMQFIHDIQDSHKTVTNIPSKSSDQPNSVSTNEILELEENAVHTQKRRKILNNYDILETLSSIMKEPVKIDTSLLQEKTVRAPEQDNITNIISVIGNLLRDFPNNEGFSFALKLLQLTSERGDELRTEV